VAAAPNIPVVLAGWSLTQLGFNALLAAEVAVIADQIPEEQRGTVSGVLGICIPVALVVGAYVVNLVAPLGQVAMFLAPAAIAAVTVLTFMSILNDRVLSPADRPAWSARELVSSFYVNPRKAPDFSWAWLSRFLFVLGQSFLLTYQAFYLLNKLGVSETRLPDEVFKATWSRRSSGSSLAFSAGASPTPADGARSSSSPPRSSTASAFSLSPSPPG
jgi:predicted MFS family arabinose efflux permease